MKKCLISLLAFCFATLMMVMPVLAQDDIHVLSDCDLLTDEEYEKLEKKAAAISEAFDSGVYILITYDMKDYGYNDIGQFAEAIYNQYELGRRNDHDGIVLALSMAERDFDLCAHGDFANYCYTDYAKDVMDDYFLDDFRNDDWYYGFDDYLNQCNKMLEAGKNGNPVDVPPKDKGKAAASGGLIGAIVAAFAALGKNASLKKELKTTGTKHTAYEYVYNGRVMMRKHRDIFLRRDVVRVPIQQNRSSGGGGHGGTTVNSGGFSHHSGKF